ncbi:hypothetical protein PSTT_08635 [Puccinia striiformis]|uniref:Uncharacterized protein n=1 Tax=Puccinia striiformis TaxID=27350 RepID=A0A2S4VBQ5_9BASI|nr:hypothetical protein PSTT_08635 [Puccinia striiformis]
MNAADKSDALYLMYCAMAKRVSNAEVARCNELIEAEFALNKETISTKAAGLQTLIPDTQQKQATTNDPKGLMACLAMLNKKTPSAQEHELQLFLTANLTFKTEDIAHQDFPLRWWKRSSLVPKNYGDKGGPRMRAGEAPARRQSFPTSCSDALPPPPFLAHEESKRDSLHVAASSSSESLLDELEPLQAVRMQFPTSWRGSRPSGSDSDELEAATARRKASRTIWSFSRPSKTLPDGLEAPTACRKASPTSWSFSRPSKTLLDGLEALQAVESAS